MKSFKIAVLSVATSVVTAVAAAQAEGMELLRQMEAKFANVQSVAGSFSQSRKDPTFKTESTVPAQFQILKPSYFRAVYQAENGQKPAVQLISDKTYYQYVPEFNQVNTYKFRGDSNVRDLNYLLLGFGAKADEVNKVYKVSELENGYGVMMVPRNPSEASFKYIAMEVDKSSLLPTRFTMRQPDNTDLSVRLNTQGLQLNAQLSPSDFRPNFPGAKQVPLD